MAILSYLDDLSIMAVAQQTQIYDNIRNQIIASRDTLDVLLEDCGEVYGFCITENHALTELYRFPVFVVRFSCSRIDTLHTPKQLDILCRLFQLLEKRMKRERGYYNLRLPANLMDCVQAYQKLTLPAIFCGGSVALLSHGAVPNLDSMITCSVQEVSQDYLNQHYEELLSLTQESFRTYQGQYHLSPVTAPLADRVYDNWIRTSLANLGNHRMIVAEQHDQAVGFGLLSYTDQVLELDLTAVSPSYRGQSIYRSMMAYMRELSIQEHRSMISCTQLDNYASQNTWITVGLKPYFTFYNIHYNLL